MGKVVHDDVLDGALNIIKNNATGLSANDAEPTDRTNAVTNSPTGSKLALITVSGTDFTVADDAGGGRKVTVAQKTETAGVDVTGTVNHVALTDATRLLYVTTVSPTQAVTSGNDITIQTWDISIGDPT